MYRNVAELLLLNVNRYPAKTALVYQDKRITYAGLNQQVNRVANGLIRLGIKPGDKVGYLMANSHELVEVYYAIQKIGAVAVPLNSRIIPREIAYLVNHSDCKALIYDESQADKVNAAGNDLAVEFLIGTGRSSGATYTLAEMAAHEGTEEPPLFQDETALSRIQFTGGTTGLPKGVMRTHRADLCEIIGVMVSNGIGTSPDEVALIQCPLDHHGGHSWFTSALAAGATVIICGKFQAEEILSLIERERVTYMILLPPSTYLRLLDCPSLNRYDLRSVKLVQSAAGATSPEIIKRIYQAFPNSRLNYGWGQTESGLGTSMVLSRSLLERRDPALSSIGKPMPFIELKIVDEQDRELGPDQVGECLVKSPAGMSGYYNQPELTRQYITPDGWIRTGDMMKKDGNGYFYLVSRKKDMIKSGGENVFAKEVEDVIRQHPSVIDCVVFGIPHRQLGEMVTAVVQLRENRTMTLEELQSHCKSTLASYKKPLYAEFVYTFPMDDAGKVAKHKLVEFYRKKLTQGQDEN